MKLRRLWPWREYQVIHEGAGVIICTIEKCILGYWKVVPNTIPANLYSYDLHERVRYYQFESKDAAINWVKKCQNS